MVALWAVLMVALMVEMMAEIMVAWRVELMVALKAGLLVMIKMIGRLNNDHDNNIHEYCCDYYHNRNNQ